MLSVALAEVFPVNNILVNGPNSSRINIVFMGDGYTQNQMDLFIADVHEVTDELFNEVPYENYKNFFNVYAIEVPSNESGTDHPGTAPDCGGDVNNVFFADTYFDCAFDQYNIHRLIVIQDYAAAYNVLADNLPQWDVAFIMVNHTMYGGSGGAFATFTRNTSSTEIAIHELGHSFPGLSDEYWAGFQYANENANMTQESDPNQVRWSSWLYDNGIGIYNYEAPGNDWHRPHQNCKMRYLGPGFCSVCTEQTIMSIYNLVDIYTGFEPAEQELSINMSVDPLIFSTENILPEPNSLEYTWYVDGSAVTNDPEFSLYPQNYNLGNHVVAVEILDNTNLVRNDPNGLLHSEIVWNVEITGIAGDVNSDGIINVQDVILSVAMVLNGQYQSSADLNGDGLVDVLDIVLIVGIILNP